MAPARRRQATPDEIARFGHIATFLREQLAQRGWTVSRLGKELGGGGTTAHPWVHGFSPPSRTAAKKLSALFGVDAGFFAAREPGDEPVAMPQFLRRIEGPAKAKAADVLVFRAMADGQVRISLDVVLDAEHGTRLFRLLLDAGLISPEASGA